MQATLKKRKIISQDKTVYMELYGDNRVCYRVTISDVTENENTYQVYGIEAQMKIGPVRFNETIEDFAKNRDMAVEFAETLVKYSVKPADIYDAALTFLGGKI